MPESFRYLFGQHRFREAREVLQKAADYNKEPVDFTSARFAAEIDSAS